MWALFTGRPEMLSGFVVTEFRAQSPQVQVAFLDRLNAAAREHAASWDGESVTLATRLNRIVADRFRVAADAIINAQVSARMEG